MVTAPRGTNHRSTGSAGPASRRDVRLAELVAELTTVGDDAALDAVRDQGEAADPLLAVARALTTLRRETEPEDRLRVVGFLRPDRRRLPRRPRAAAPGDPHPFDPHLVHHGSLRRWERSGDDTTTVTVVHPGGTDDEAQVIDLRDRTARFRRPSPGSSPASSGG